MKLIEASVTREELRTIAKNQFGDFVKAVVDLEQKVMAIGAELHADEEAYLLERGSEQRNLWGVNLFPDRSDDSFVEFDSMINIRPSQGNRSRGVEDSGLRERIRSIIDGLVSRD
ncbi:hypothetical protein HY479_02315 [Candidatus Uhrbacteria bacterium]|nr:hypothetical protein [Candidatus Uhrbacteria bacterium]